jgi:replicative DNA helicase
VEGAIETAARMGDLPLWIDTETYGLNQILAQIAMHKHRHGIQWAAIDHVGLIQTERFNSRNDQIGHITAAIKRCAKQLGIPIIALFQLSRASEKDGRKPGLHDLRDSGNIEQDLDVAIFLHVDAKDRGAPTRRVELGILKNRSGRSSWLSEWFEFDGAVQTFREIATGYAPHPHSEPRDEVPL